MSTTKDALPEPVAYIVADPDIRPRLIARREDAQAHLCDLERISGQPLPFESNASGLFSADQMHAFRAEGVAEAQASKQAPTEWTPEMSRAVQLYSELGAYAAANLSGAYDLFDEFWRIAIQASRQAEAQAKSEPAALTDAQLDALMPDRLHSMLCTKCGYQNLETTAPAGPSGAPCENANCQYTAFVHERDYTSDQVRTSMRAAIAATQEQKL